MANHVYTNFTFENISSEGAEFLDDIFGSEEEGYVFEKVYGEYEPTREWMTENVSAKWCYFEEPFYNEKDRVYTVTAISAWDAPHDFMTELFGKVLSLSDKVDMFCTFEDEMPNFIGVYSLSHTGAEVNEYVEQENYELVLGCPHWDSEIDEEHEEWWDSLSEYFNNVKTEFRVSIRVMEEENR